MAPTNLLEVERMSQSRTSRRIVFMDAGRGMAALLVLHHHVMVIYGDRIGDAIGHGGIMHRGLEAASALNSAAVHFFFFLSGWAIYLSLGRVRRENGGVEWGRYIWYRCRRILPLYWLALAWSWLLFVPANDDVTSASLGNFLGNLAFLQTLEVTRGWFSPYALNGPLWSLSYEAWYYVTPPLLIVALAKAAMRTDARWYPTTLVAMSLVAAATGFIFTRLVCFTPMGVFAVYWPIWVAGFAFGAGAGQPEAFTRLVAMTATATAVLLALSFAIKSDTIQALALGLAVAVVAMPIAAAWSSRPVSPRLGIAVAPLVFVGGGSYALYLLHYPMLRWLDARNADASVVALAIVVTVLATPYLEYLIQSLVRIEFNVRGLSAPTKDVA